MIRAIDDLFRDQDFTTKSILEMPKLTFLKEYLIGHKGIIAGGCFKNIFTDKKVKDVDIFFVKESFYKEALSYYENNEDYEFVYENDKAISFLNKKTKIRIELIKLIFDNVITLLNSFDFTVAKFALYRTETVTEEGIEIDDNVCFVNRFFEDLVNKKLVIDKDLLYPISSFERSYRYRSYGFVLCTGSKNKLIQAIKESDSPDLEEALYNGID